MTSVSERDESGNYHIGGSAYPSVTTVLGTMPKPGLERWKETTPNWREVRDRAALVGTLTHRRCLNPLAERTLPVEPVPDGMLTDDLKRDVEVACALFDRQLEHLPIGEHPHVEETMWSDEYGYAGTADIVTDEAIIDLKTSKRVYDSYPLQLAAYAEAARERGIADPDRGIIVRLNYREPDSQVLAFDRDELDDRFEEFCDVLDGFDA